MFNALRQTISEFKLLLAIIFDFLVDLLVNLICICTPLRFIEQQVIPRFKDQRERSQFAVAILCTKEECENDLQAINYSPSNWQGYPILDSRQIGMPTKYDDFDNYIVSRPWKREDFHAEELLIPELDHLYSAFKSKHNEAPSYIILYTWITPCSSCAQMILDKLSQPPYRDTPRLVAYTTNTQKRGDDIRGARDSLRIAGIKVIHVPYEQLPIKNPAN